jgi:hypothetical protein
MYSTGVAGKARDQPAAPAGNATLTRRTRRISAMSVRIPAGGEPLRASIHRKVHQFSFQMSEKDHISVKVSRKLMQQVDWHWTGAGSVSSRWWGA